MSLTQGAAGLPRKKRKPGVPRMAPRPYWKGYLKLSLVSCAVAFYPSASKSERISFHWLNRETGNRLRQQMVDSDTNEPVEREDRVRGYQVAKSDYLTIEEEDLDAVEIESSHTIDIERFVPRSEIDPVYFDTAYYLAPNDKVAEEAFAVIRDAMAAQGVAGLGRAVISRRERLFVLEPRDKGILATVLHYNNEVRDDHAYFDEIPDVKVGGEVLDLAKHIIQTKMGHFDITKFEDRYENALSAMINAKKAGRPIEAAKPQPPSNVINLMDALRNSIAAEKGGLKKSDLAAEEKAASKPAKKQPRSASDETRRKRNAAQSPQEPKQLKRAAGQDPRRPSANPRTKPEHKTAGRS
jgi:DNA end-binding protein Ku